MATLAPGSDFGEYRIERELARGGMGVVYKATRTRTGQSIALKCIAPERAAERDYRGRFVREAQVLVGLQHPRIVPLIDWGEVDGVLYLALGYLDGPNLEVLIEREGPLSLARTIELLAPVAEALDAAHRRGYIHRDVKPANVMLDGDGNVYLTDFGLGKLAGSSGLSQAGAAIGTLAYMSPEQFTGKVDPALASRIDIYALGCVFHACLTRQEVVPTDNYARAMHAVVYEPPPALSRLRPSLPVELDAVELRALAKDPADRYSSASAFIAAARAVLLAHPEPPPGAIPVPPPPRQEARQAIAEVADLSASPPPPPPSPATELVPPPSPATELAPAQPAAVVVRAFQRAVAGSRPPRWWVGAALVVAGVLGLTVLAGMVVFGGRGSATPSPQIAAALATPSSRPIDSRRPIPVSPPPTPTATPRATPTPFPGASGDQRPIAGNWPTAASTVKQWIPASIRSTCAAADGVQYLATAEWLCDTDSLEDFKGKSIQIAYLFFRTEAAARLAYEQVLKDFDVEYNTGQVCPKVKAESGWLHGDTGPNLGRVFCALSDGEAQLYQTYYGMPVVVILYRTAGDLDVIDKTWRSNGGAVDPDTGTVKPTP